MIPPVKPAKMAAASVLVELAERVNRGLTGCLRARIRGEEAVFFLDRGRLIAARGRARAQNAADVRGILDAVASWSAAEISFERDCRLPTGEAPLQVATAELLRNAGRETPPDVAAAALGSLERPLQLAVAMEELPQRLERVSQEEFYLLSRVDGRLSAERVLTLVPGDRQVAMRNLFGLVLAGVVALEGPEPVAAKPAPVRSERDGALADLVVAYAKMQRQNHYEILGVPRTASDGEIHRRYLVLAKTYHPDNQFQGDVASGKDKLEALFARINEAYTVLSDVERRRRYDESLVAGAPRSSSQDEEQRRVMQKKMAQANFETARAYVAGGNFHTAIELLEAAMHWEPERLDLQLLLAEALMHNPAWQRKAADLYEKILERDPASSPALLALGRIYRKKGLGRRALEAYQRLLTLEPDNSEAHSAAAELRKTVK